MRRLARILLSLVAALVLLEVALQIAAVIALLVFARDEVASGDDGGKTILCLGDSFTYGVGSTSIEQSYPGVMGQVLTERLDVAPSVVNAGWPGRTSRDILAQIDDQLARHAPDLVFILIGVNDMWAKPGLLELGDVATRTDGAPRWRWRWRTGRLLAIAFSGRDRAPARHDATPEQPPAATPARPIASPERERPAPVAAAGDQPFDRAVALLAGGDAEGAVAAFETALRQQPDRAAEIHQGLVQSYTLLGRIDDAAAALQWLEREHAERHARDVTEALAVSLAVLRQSDRVYEVAKEGVERYPESSSLWWCLGQEHYRNGRLAPAEEAFDRALACAGFDDPVWRAVLMRDTVLACAGRDPKKAIKLAVSALLTDNDHTGCLIALEPVRKHLTPELIETSIGELDLDPDERRLADSLFRAVIPLEQSHVGPTRVLEAHLRQIIDRCLGQGARPVILGYPMPLAGVDELLVTLERQTAAEVIAMHERLDEALRSRRREELFIPDGHCTDAGYRIMGEAAAEKAERLLR